MSSGAIFNRTSIPQRLLLTSAILLIVALIILSQKYLGVLDLFDRVELATSSRHNPDSLSQQAQPPPPNHIPNQVHYVYVLKDGVSDFSFEFKHYLSVYASWLYLRPDIIYLHTNASPSAITAALSGRRGKWSQLLLSLPSLQINPITAPTVAENGHPIDIMEHKSDFLRQEAVRALGGVYLDFDAHALRDVRVLRESGFAVVFGRQHAGEINEGVFLGRKSALVLELWRDEMHRVYDGGWTTHGNGVLTRVCPRVMRIPGEVLVLEQDALQPGSWLVEDNVRLFGIHGETRSNLEGVGEGDPLPEYNEELMDRWEHPDRFPDWERDYSSTYVLHAFDPKRNGNPVQGFEHITPRYVLERQSNFARAVYPVAKHMYDAGLIKIDDPYHGNLNASDSLKSGA
ncbi:putative glycosyl transferase [Lasiosphaeria hispida]|uniref:Glycosyl transferase n=1 Tax=Lasiosphaeria hispida TaxID=260671 RepID=A0AAJ0HD03_9PEZI|nr:putative glycosyl transferase [Lasiosphaeria hispida]